MNNKYLPSLEIKSLYTNIPDRLNNVKPLTKSIYELEYNSTQYFQDILLIRNIN